MSPLLWLAIGLSIVLSFLVWRLERRARVAEEELALIASFCVLTHRFDQTCEHRDTLRLLVESVTPACPRFAKLAAGFLQNRE